MLIGMMGCVGPRYHILDRGTAPPREGANFWGVGIGWVTVTYRENVASVMRPNLELL